MQTIFPVDPGAAVLVQLLERISSRDVKALRTLYELTSPNLLVIALRILRRREFAEEVLQDTFVSVWKFAPDYNSSVSPPMAWMAVIVRSRTFDYLRRRKSSAGPEIEWSDKLDEILTAETLDPCELAALNQQARHLETCMNFLQTNQRRALELAYFHDLTHREIAEEMTVPLGTVKAWLRRGTEALKVSLGTNGGTVSSTSPATAKHLSLSSARAIN
ncbi:MULTISPECIES: RNA polymerase sigma factor [Burkholderiaceae]|uniref:RNA polymerase sigma factor n=1 Tax=Burkholderiaceae TaxID=119060 RepID=UPI00084CE7F7|nr:MULTISPECIES: sigma-70 family RNA polymerase sigma factor [Burkholderiaceae]